jgi:putative ABC transport system substrate-binding protein
MARPAGNITGFTSFEWTVGGKWLQTLKEIAPHVTRSAVIFNPDNLAAGGFLGAIEAAVPSLGVQVTPVAVRASVDSERAVLERAVDAFGHEPNGGMIVLPDFVIITLRQSIVTLAA